MHHTLWCGAVRTVAPCVWRASTVSGRSAATVAPAAAAAAGWETVIGLELHVQVDSVTKLFSGALRLLPVHIHPHAPVLLFD